MNSFLNSDNIFTQEFANDVKIICFVRLGYSTKQMKFSQFL